MILFKLRRRQALLGALAAGAVAGPEAYGQDNTRQGLLRLRVGNTVYLDHGWVL